MFEKVGTSNGNNPYQCAPKSGGAHDKYNQGLEQSGCIYNQDLITE